MATENYRSVIADVDCGHRHQTRESAERCAANRVRAGELRRYMGDHQPLTVDANELAQLVRLFNGAMRVVG